MKLESTRILKKMDGFSVLLAFVMSTAFQGFYSVAYELSARMTSWMGGAAFDNEFGGFMGSGSTWQDKYLNPIFNCLVWLVAIELVLQAAKYLKAQNKK